jgi:hypothetical protein
VVTTISLFVDESGKFSDNEVVALGTVVSLGRSHVGHFEREWESSLRKNGLAYLRMTEASNFHHRLSQTVEAKSPDERIQALLPFISCVRRHFQMITGVAIDVREFQSLPQQYREIWSDDPCYTAFARAILQIVQESPDDGLVLLYCDDEEKTAWPTYQLYRKINIQMPEENSRASRSPTTDSLFHYKQPTWLLGWFEGKRCFDSVTSDTNSGLYFKK